MLKHYPQIYPQNRFVRRLIRRLFLPAFLGACVPAGCLAAFSVCPPDPPAFCAHL